MSSLLLWKEKSGAQYALRLDLTVSEKHKWASKVTEHPVEAGADITDHVIPELEEVELEVFFSAEPLNARTLYVTNPADQTQATEMVPFVQSALPQSQSATVTFMRQGNNPSVRTLNTPQPDLQVPFNPAGAAVALTEGLIKQATQGSQTTAQAQAGFMPEPRSQSISFLVYAYTNTGGDLIGAILETLRRLKNDSIVCDLFTSKLAYQKVVISNVSASRAAEDGTGVSVTLSFKEIRTVFAGLDTVPLPTVKKATPKSTGSYTIPEVDVTPTTDVATQILSLIDTQLKAR